MLAKAQLLETDVLSHEGLSARSDSRCDLRERTSLGLSHDESEIGLRISSRE